MLNFVKKFLNKKDIVPTEKAQTPALQTEEDHAQLLLSQQDMKKKEREAEERRLKNRRNRILPVIPLWTSGSQANRHTAGSYWKNLRSTETKVFNLVSRTITEDGHEDFSKLLFKYYKGGLISRRKVKNICKMYTKGDKVGAWNLFEWNHYRFFPKMNTEIAEAAPAGA